MEINFGKVRAESVPLKFKKLKHMTATSHIVTHKPKKEPTKYVFPWEEYKKQTDRSYTVNVLLGKGK
jgi:hypothetical protein